MLVLPFLWRVAAFLAARLPEARVGFVLLATPVLVALALGLLSFPPTAEAEQAGKTARIGVLRPAPTPGYGEAFRQGLRENGYVERKNIVIEERFSEGRNERFPDLVAELIRLKVDVIVASGTPAAVAAKQATRTIPIVIVAVADPVGIAVVTNLARPEANITGISLYADIQTVGKRLDLLKQAVPAASRVAVLWDPTNAFDALAVRQLRESARALGLSVQSVEVEDPTGFERGFAAILGQRPDALYVSEGHLNVTQRNRILRFAADARIPAIYGFRQFVEDGGLMSYGASLTDLYRRSAMYVARILKGTKPADLPVEQPAKHELVINARVAKALGITLPVSLLVQADRLVE